MISTTKRCSAPDCRACSTRSKRLTLICAKGPLPMQMRSTLIQNGKPSEPPGLPAHSTAEFKSAGRYSTFQEEMASSRFFGRAFSLVL